MVLAHLAVVVLLLHSSVLSLTLKKLCIGSEIANKIGSVFENRSPPNHGCH